MDGRKGRWLPERFIIWVGIVRRWDFGLHPKWVGPIIAARTWRRYLFWVSGVVERIVLELQILKNDQVRSDARTVCPARKSGLAKG